MKNSEINDLILRGHFEALRNKATKASSDRVTDSLIVKCSNYLNNLKNKGIIDSEGEELLSELQHITSDKTAFNNLPKMPMKKMGKKRHNDDAKKTG